MLAKRRKRKWESNALEEGEAIYAFDHQIARPCELLLRYRVAIGSGGGSLSLSLSDDVGLVNGSLYDLLLIGVKVLCEVFVQRRLFLLKFYCLLACMQCTMMNVTYEAAHA